MTSVVDTSLLVAAFDSSDPRQAAARSALEKASPAVIPTEILVETLGVIQVKARRREAAQALEILVRLPNVTWSERCDFKGAITVYERFPALSFPDAIVVRECALRDAEPLTFDEAQRDATAAQ